MNAMNRYLTCKGLYKMLSTTPIDTLIVKNNQPLLSLTLNREKSLNALDFSICQQIISLFDGPLHSTNSDNFAFILKGAGNKAFCAGGDVKAIWYDMTSCSPEDRGTGKKGLLHCDFFRTEYTMNYLIGSSIKPQVSLWDGIVMGGGVGLSVLGEFRVATEKTLFAMPETAIGIFPDVGSSQWLPHLQKGYGNYIGLTGCRLKANDLLHSGIATHFIHSESLSDLEMELVHALKSAGLLNPSDCRGVIKSILEDFQAKSIALRPMDTTQSLLVNNSESIAFCFENSQSVEDIIDRLKALSSKGNEWAVQTIQMLNRMSPMALKIALKQLQMGKSLNLKKCLEMEFRMMMKCTKAHDMEEGIKSLLVNKPATIPKWNPIELSVISDEMVNQYFLPLENLEYELNLSE